MKIVCEKCLEHEPGLKKFISSNGQKNKKCSYCSRKSNKFKKISLEEIIKHIEICLMERYILKKEKPKNTTKLKSLNQFAEEYIPVNNDNLFKDLENELETKLGNVYLKEKKDYVKSWDNFF